ncbi:ribonuclease BN [Taibaiella sp. KBW10]|uniref:YihY/virulence factor BrkB family protein n=1 Tax=Taibaiella sp. KBW10 TaxID=2153357 RepID=UPI000F596ED1|nr:YihY/virulence factor BrkB family protein [Taibaiella sp. KBW10]RQO31068.1 ribonuclease BN [Taibaiella sp. KBW10]
MEYNDKKITGKGVWTVLKNSFTGFGDDKVTKLSGSLAYATMFSLAPFFVVLLAILGFVLGNDAIEGQLFDYLKNYMGSDAASQVQSLVKNASLSGKSTTAAIVGGATLLFGATTVFAEIQDSINIIWGIKPKPKKGWIKMLLNRLLSFSLIISIGFLLIVSLGVNTLVDALSDRLMILYPNVTVAVFYVLNVLLTFLIITTLFAVIFKILPDAKIKFRDVLSGAVATSVLFLIGRFLISFYIGSSNYSNSYGPAAAIIVLMAWVYYSSLILYFGAEFTKAWAVYYGNNIYPNQYAVTTKIVEVHMENAPVEALNKTEISEEVLKQSDANIEMLANKSTEEMKAEVKDIKESLDKEGNA